MRVGTSVAEQTSSSGFKFEGGNGEIVNCVVVVDHNETFNETRTGFAVTIQPMNKDWVPTAAEPTTEFLSAGPVEKFHPGNTASSDSPESTDLGDAAGTEGNCLESVEGKRPDKKSKFSKFCASLEEFGFPAAMLNGYAPNLIGLKAEFTQRKEARGANYTGKEDPTQLVVVKIAEMPKFGGNAASKVAVAKPATATTAKPAAASTPAAPAADAGDGTDEIGDKVIELLGQLGAASAGKTLTRQQVGARMVSLLAKNSVAPAMHKPIQAYIKDDGKFTGAAALLGWTIVDTGEVQIAA